VDKVREDEAKFNTQSETYKAEIEDLRKKLAEANENFAVAKASQEISQWYKTRLEKNVEELQEILGLREKIENQLCQSRRLFF
jgi:phage shock protein A